MSVKHKKIILAVAMLFAVNILIIALAQSADAALYKRGSSGATVTTGGTGFGVMAMTA